MCPREVNKQENSDQLQSEAAWQMYYKIAYEWLLPIPHSMVNFCLDIYHAFALSKVIDLGTKNKPTRLELVTEKVNIYKLPSESEIVDIGEKNEITMGDAHGNSIKILFTFIKYGVVTGVSEEIYNRLLEIYKMPYKSLSKEVLEEYEHIINNLNFDPTKLVRFLGDTLADRGNNDYFTLILFNAMHKAGVKYEMLLSNHDIEFIAAVEQDTPFLCEMLGYSTVRSMHNLQACIEEGYVAKEQVLAIVDKAYLPVLKLISYSADLEANKITIYSHAVAGVDEIKAAAEALGVKYEDNTIKKLAWTIDRINLAFQEFVKNKEVSTKFCSIQQRMEGGGYYVDDEKISIFTKLIWGRKYAKVNRPVELNGFRIAFCHGHDSQDPRQNEDHIHNLDTILGKTDACNQGILAILVTKGNRVSQAAKLAVKEVEEVLPAMKNNHYLLNFMGRLDRAANDEYENDEILVINACSIL